MPYWRDQASDTYGAEQGHRGSLVMRRRTSLIAMYATVISARMAGRPTGRRWRAGGDVLEWEPWIVRHLYTTVDRRFGPTSAP